VWAERLRVHTSAASRRSGHALTLSRASRTLGWRRRVADAQRTVDRPLVQHVALPCRTLCAFPWPLSSTHRALSLLAIVSKLFISRLKRLPPSVRLQKHARAPPAVSAPCCSSAHCFALLWRPLDTPQTDARMGRGGLGHPCTPPSPLLTAPSSGRVAAGPKPSGPPVAAAWAAAPSSLVAPLPRAWRSPALAAVVPCWWWGVGGMAWVQPQTLNPSWDVVSGCGAMLVVGSGWDGLGATLNPKP
jgi:hypothetical protein